MNSISSGIWEVDLELGQSLRFEKGKLIFNACSNKYLVVFTGTCIYGFISCCLNSGTCTHASNN